MKKVIAFLFLSLLLISSCVIGSIVQGFSLDPPLGLVGYQLSSNSIEIEWYGNNGESYFSGYVVFITTNSNDLYLNRDSTNHFDKPYLTNSSGGLPTVSASITTVTTKYSYEIKNLPNGSNLVVGVTYYIAVASYSSSKSVFSPLSNITNVTLTN
jgi:hypothetical protein